MEQLARLAKCNSPASDSPPVPTLTPAVAYSYPGGCLLTPQLALRALHNLSFAKPPLAIG